MDGYNSAILPLLREMEPGPLAEANFVAAEYFRRADVPVRQARLAEIIAEAIVPRLRNLHQVVLDDPQSGTAPSEPEIAELARLVLSPDLDAAAAYVTLLRERGLSMDTLFVELLEPAARHLGTLWDRSECDFVDVTLGLGRLQKLLAVFNCTHTVPTLNQRRRVLMATTPGDPHFFGVSMVEKFLRAGGWDVEVELGSDRDRLAGVVRDGWFAVAGLTLGSERHLDGLAGLIAAIRAQSANPAIGIMVGGPVFTSRPDLATAIGADATATAAPTAVVLAQKLFDIGMQAHAAAPGRGRSHHPSP